MVCQSGKPAGPTAGPSVNPGGLCASAFPTVPAQRPPVSNIFQYSLTLASSLTPFCVPHMFPIPRVK